MSLQWSQQSVPQSNFPKSNLLVLKKVTKNSHSNLLDWRKDFIKTLVDDIPRIHVDQLIPFALAISDRGSPKKWQN